MLARQANGSDRLSHPPPKPLDSIEPTDSSFGASRHAVIRMLEGLAFSSALAAGIGGMLSLVSSRILESSSPASSALLAAAGTFIIYNLDRLRDVEQDRSTSPRRTDYVSRNRLPLGVSIGIVALAFTATWWQASPAIKILCLAIGIVGMLHRRLKGIAVLKTIYVSGAWVAACVGIPWLSAELGFDGSRVATWLAGILFSSLAANLIASNLRDDEAALIRGSSRATLWFARVVLVAAIGLALAAPSRLAPLVWIPLFEGLALVAYRPTERYGHLVVDGAIGVGALASVLHLARFT